jgi:exodeoxyribonuclease VII large subunit
VIGRESFQKCYYLHLTYSGHPGIADLKAITVTELNTIAKGWIASSPGLNDIWVSGEISNLTKHNSGHYYFTLKDEKSEIRCTLFKYSRPRLTFEPEENLKVLALGSMNVYVPKGSYQFNVDDMQRHGVGDRYLAYEALKKKLEKEGLFDEKRKRPLPRYPLRIGVVTSPTGAAIRDILTITARRFRADIVLAPALVQGNEAAPSIVRAISLLNDIDVDVIIVGRGGGSLEDLWSFNEESVARAIYASKVPVVSAVGHETDLTIADLVADLRAPTPSAAAELVLPDRAEEDRNLAHLLTRAQRSLFGAVERMRRRFLSLDARWSPEDVLEYVNHQSVRLDEISIRIDMQINRILDARRHRLASLQASLDGLSPVRVLERGYCVLQSGDGSILSSVNSVDEGDDVRMVLKDGALEAAITKKVLKNV